MNLPDTWRTAAPRAAEALPTVAQYVEQERTQHIIYPSENQVFSALERTPPEAVKVVILGQDPYHGEGQAHGLAFSVNKGQRIPPSLRNIYKERQSDLGISPTDHGDLGAWADRGVLLLNTVLTVRAATAASHRRQGWERVTTELLAAVASQSQPVAFIAWGRPAQRLADRLPLDGHFLHTSAHPSPLSASRGFFGSRPFSRVNIWLESVGRAPVDWSN